MGPNASLALATTARPIMRFPAPPTTAPMPNGSARPRKAVPWRLNSRLRKAFWMAPNDAETRGQLLERVMPQAWVLPLPLPSACPLRAPSRAVPSSPSMMAMTMVLALSGSVRRIPWSSAKEVAYRAVASRKPTVAARKGPARPRCRRRARRRLPRRRLPRR